MTRKPFTATIMYSMADGEVQVLPFNDNMAIDTPEGPILITREQAKAFFGLIDPVTN